MKLYNHEIEAFIHFLMTEELIGKQSRMRTRFCKLLGERAKEVEDERQDLIKQYSTKDENDKPKVETNEDGSIIYPLTDAQAFYKELSILLDEEFIIDETLERKDMLETVRDIVLDSKQTFSGQAAYLHSRFCDLVEEVKYE